MTRSAAHYRKRPRPNLTPRERQIVQARANGLAAKQVARQLGIAHGTVKNILLSARRRLGARDTAHLAALAWAKGFIL